MEQSNPIDEARRYVANAQEIIQKSKYDPVTKLYLDKKYVRIAGDTLWKGCLIALDAVLNVRQGKAVRRLKNTEKPPPSAMENCYSMLTRAMRPCTCTWATTERKTRRPVKAVSTWQTTSLTIVLNSIATSPARNY